MRAEPLAFTGPSKEVFTCQPNGTMRPFFLAEAINRKRPRYRQHPALPRQELELVRTRSDTTNIDIGRLVVARCTCAAQGRFFSQPRDCKPERFFAIAPG